jgi:hypothetical protein
MHAHCSHRLHGGHRNRRELRDVAEGGLRFVATELLEVPCSLTFRSGMTRQRATLVAQGVTAWTETRQVNGKDVHLVGAKFEEILGPQAETAWFSRASSRRNRNPGKCRLKPAHKPRAGPVFDRRA